MSLMLEGHPDAPQAKTPPNRLQSEFLGNLEEGDDGVLESLIEDEENDSKSKKSRSKTQEPPPDEEEDEDDEPEGDEEDEEDEEEDEEDEEDLEDLIDQHKIVEYPKEKPATYDYALKFYYNEQLKTELSGYEGVDVNNKASIDKFVAAAWKQSPYEIKQVEERCKEYARYAAEKYKTDVIQPYEEKCEEARISQEFAKVLKKLPDIPDHWLTMKKLAPKFFKENPELEKQPLASIPLLYALAVRENRGKKPKPKQSRQTVPNTGRSQTRQSSGSRGKRRGQTEEDMVFGQNLHNSGEWIASLI